MQLTNAPYCKVLPFKHLSELTYF